MTTVSTVNGRPVITGADEFNNRVYEEARKNRLADIIGDYMGDDDASALTFYNDLNDELQTWIDYHRTAQEKATAMMTLVKGHKPIDFISPDEC